MVKDAKYLIKFNLDKALIYFMSDSDSDDDKNPKFETRGIKAEYIVISNDYAPKIMAAGGSVRDEEDEIFEAINKIYSDPNNKDQYGKVAISEYTEYKLKKMLSESAFDYLKSGKSAYGKFSTYGGRFGTYSALNPTSEFYQRKRMKAADGGMMAKGGTIRKGSYFVVLKGMDGIKRFRIRDIEGNKVTTQYTKNDGTIITNHNDKKDNLEWLAENGYIKKVTEKEYWDKKYDNYAKGGTIEEQLEKINIYNDLDAFEYDQYKKFTDNGMTKVDALKVIINDVEGDTSQLSKKLASIAKKIK
jgi:hypothetical protein